MYQDSVKAHDVVSSFVMVLHLHASNSETELYLLKALRVRFLLVGSKQTCMMSHENTVEAYLKVLSLCIQAMTSHARRIWNRVLQNSFRRPDESHVFQNLNNT